MQKFIVSRDDSIYEAWPDVALTPRGELVCVFSECTHHGDRSYTRIMVTRSADRGRSWSPKQAITEGTAGKPYFYNCARVSQLRDGRMAVLVDQIAHGGENQANIDNLKNVLYFSEDGGKSWSEQQPTPIRGIVPDKILELTGGRWIVGAHYKSPKTGFLEQYTYYSDDMGKTWSAPVAAGVQEGLNLCEISIVEAEAGVLVALMRENSMRGLDCYKAISRDNGQSWGELITLPLPGCHRPVGGALLDGRFLITYRFIQGGKGFFGAAQNFFLAVLTKESLLSPARAESFVRIMPVDYDRSLHSDLGYSGWVQFPDGEIYIVNYIMDDSPKCQIRGYSLQPTEIMFVETGK